MEDELSSNKHTERGRKRRETMTDMEATIEQAKNADRQAVRRGLIKLRENAVFQNATTSERKGLEKTEEEKIIHQR